MTEKTYSYSYDEEQFHGKFESVQDAADEAFSDNEDCTYIWVGEVIQPTVGQFVDAERIIEGISESAYDEIGEHAEDWPTLNKVQCAELEKLISDWIEERSPPNFWTVVKVVEIARPA